MEFVLELEFVLEFEVLFDPAPSGAKALKPTQLDCVKTSPRSTVAGKHKNEPLRFPKLFFL